VLFFNYAFPKQFIIFSLVTLGLLFLFPLCLCKLKEEALDRSLWRIRFERSYWTLRTTDCGKNKLTPCSEISYDVCWIVVFIIQLCVITPFCCWIAVRVKCGFIFSNRDFRILCFGLVVWCGNSTMHPVSNCKIKSIFCHSWLIFLFKIYVLLSFIKTAVGVYVNDFSLLFYTLTYLSNIHNCIKLQIIFFAHPFLKSTLKWM
jgi:hypothetical protein